MEIKIQKKRPVNSLFSFHYSSLFSLPVFLFFLLAVSHIRPAAMRISAAKTAIYVTFGAADGFSYQPMDCCHRI